MLVMTWLMTLFCGMSGKVGSGLTTGCPVGNLLQSATCRPIRGYGSLVELKNRSSLPNLLRSLSSLLSGVRAIALSWCNTSLGASTKGKTTSPSHANLKIYIIV